MVNGQEFNRMSASNGQGIHLHACQYRIQGRPQNPRPETLDLPQTASSPSPLPGTLCTPRITPIPQRRPTCRGDTRCPGVCTDVLQDLT